MKNFHSTKENCEDFSSFFQCNQLQMQSDDSMKNILVKKCVLAEFSKGD